MFCIKCANTGRDYKDEICDCGIQVNEIEEIEDPYDRIPDNFRGISKDISDKDLITGELRQGFTLYNLAEEIVESFIKGTPYPSLFIDFSESMTGAYEFYYTVLEVYIEKTNNEPPFKFTDMFRVNNFDEKRLESTIFNTPSDMNIISSANYLLSDFSIDKYSRIKEYVKIFPYINIKRSKRLYPINMFLTIIKTVDSRRM